MSWSTDKNSLAFMTAHPEMSNPHIFVQIHFWHVILHHILAPTYQDQVLFVLLGPGIILQLLFLCVMLKRNQLTKPLNTATGKTLPSAGECIN